MSNDNVTKLIQPGVFNDQLTEILRNGARALLAKAVEAEVADFLGEHADLKTEDGHPTDPFDQQFGCYSARAGGGRGQVH